MNTFSKKIVSILLTFGMISSSFPVNIISVGAQGDEVILNPDYVNVIPGDRESGIVYYNANDVIPDNKRLALFPKSNILDDEWNAILDDARERGWLEVNEIVKQGPYNTLDSHSYETGVFNFNVPRMGGVGLGYSSFNAGKTIYPYRQCEFIEDEYSFEVLQDTCVSTYVLVHIHEGIPLKDIEKDVYIEAIVPQPDTVEMRIGSDEVRSLVKNDTLRKNDQTLLPLSEYINYYTYLINDTPNNFYNATPNHAWSHNEILPGSRGMGNDENSVVKIPGITLKTNGELSVSHSAEAGYYDLTYRICGFITNTSLEQLPDFECKDAKLSLTVNPMIPTSNETTPTPPSDDIKPSNDYISISREEHHWTPQRAAIDVLENDIVRNPHETKPTLDKYIATIDSNPPLSGATLEDGTFFIPSGMYEAGTYVIPYKLCEKKDKNKCGTADIVVEIKEIPASTPFTDSLNLEDDILVIHRTSSTPTKDASIDVFKNDFVTIRGEKKQLTPDKYTTEYSYSFSHDLDGPKLLNNIFHVPAGMYEKGEYHFSYAVCVGRDEYGDCELHNDAKIRVLIVVDNETVPPIIPPAPPPDTTTYFLVKIDANDDIITIHREYDELSKEVTVDITQNDSRLISDGSEQKRIKLGGHFIKSMGNIPIVGAYLYNDSVFHIVPGKYEAASGFIIPYTVCSQDEPDICDTANIIIKITVEENPVPPPTIPTPPPTTPTPPPTTPTPPPTTPTPPPTTPTPPPTTSGGGGGGGGGYSPTPPTNDIPSFPLFAPPIKHNQCVSHIKNLDDPKLVAYYNVLQVKDTHLVNRPITRAEFVRLVVNAAQIDTKHIDTNILSAFSDVEVSAWYAPYLAYTLANNIVSGQEIVNKSNITKKIFRPNDPISRAEVSKIFIGLLGKRYESLPKLNEISTFIDVSPSHTLAPYIQEAYNSCLLHGRNTLDGKPINDEPRRFEPQDSITLAEVSKVLYNMTHQED